jgi:hypothetical protein
MDEPPEMWATTLHRSPQRAKARTLIVEPMCTPPAREVLSPVWILPKMDIADAILLHPRSEREEPADHESTREARSPILTNDLTLTVEPCNDLLVTESSKQLPKYSTP